MISRSNKRSNVSKLGTFDRAQKSLLDDASLLSYEPCENADGVCSEVGSAVAASLPSYEPSDSVFSQSGIIHDPLRQEQGLALTAGAGSTPPS